MKLLNTTTQTTRNYRIERKYRSLTLKKNKNKHFRILLVKKINSV